MPRWRTMIAPACTAWPSPALMPSRWPTLSRPFLTEPPAFLCAIDRSSPYFCVFFGADFASAARARGLGLAAVFALSPAPVVSAFAVRLEALAAGLDASALPRAGLSEAFASEALGLVFSVFALSAASFA